MARHEWITQVGAQAAAILAVLALAGYLLRGAVRMRRATRDAWANSIGVQVAVAMGPLAERIAGHEERETTQMQQLGGRMTVLEAKFDLFTEDVRALATDLRRHMETEDR